MLFTLGDITVTRYWVVTPSGTVPIQGTRWFFRDNTSVQRVLPGWAVVCAVVFFLACFLGLLFLAVREDVITGYAEVQVTGPDGFFHISQLPARTPASMNEARQWVSYAQHLASL